MATQREMTPEEKRIKQLQDHAAWYSGTLPAQGLWYEILKEHEQAGHHELNRSDVEKALKRVSNEAEAAAKELANLQGRPAAEEKQGLGGLM